MSEAPEVAFDRMTPVVHQQQKQDIGREEAQGYWNDTHNSTIPPYVEPKSQHGTILGLRRRYFWTILVVALLLVGATIGGSVGGTLAVRNPRCVHILQINVSDIDLLLKQFRFRHKFGSCAICGIVEFSTNPFTDIPTVFVSTTFKSCTVIHPDSTQPCKRPAN